MGITKMGGEQGRVDHEVGVSGGHWQNSFSRANMNAQHHESWFDEQSRISHEVGVSNHSGDRRISNLLDNTMNPITGDHWQRSYTRAFVHEKYHEYQGKNKEAVGNHQGAAAERKRAQE